MSVAWPTNLTDPAYAPLILGAATQGQYELAWTPIQSVVAGHTVEFLFSARPLRIDGVFVNVSATIQQQVADALGAILPTPKMMDLAWLQRAATISPVTLPITSTANGMLQASAKLDAAMGDTTGALVCQKTWCIANSLVTKPGTALNYGFFCIPTSGTSWNGIATEACASFPTQPKLGRVIQGQGWAHNSAHLDYSQLCPLVHRDAKVDGTRVDIAAILTDSTLAAAVSHEGPLTLPGLRQPGVPLFSCPLPGPLATRTSFVDSAASSMCPMPPPPTNIELSFDERFRRALPWIFGGFAVAGAAAAVAWSQGWLSRARLF